VPDGFAHEVGLLISGSCPGRIAADSKLHSPKIARAKRDGGLVRRGISHTIFKNLGCNGGPIFARKMGGASHAAQIGYQCPRSIATGTRSAIDLIPTGSCPAYNSKWIANATLFYKGPRIDANRIED
jgi:hypothetical protein